MCTPSGCVQRLVKPCAQHHAHRPGLSAWAASHSMHEGRRENREREMPWTALSNDPARGAGRSVAQRWRVRGSRACASPRPRGLATTTGPAARRTIVRTRAVCAKGSGGGITMPGPHAKRRAWWEGRAGHGGVGPGLTRVPAVFGGRRRAGRAWPRTTPCTLNLSLSSPAAGLSSQWLGRGVGSRLRLSAAFGPVASVALWRCGSLWAHRRCITWVGLPSGAARLVGLKRAPPAVRSIIRAAGPP
jgi:hypothetical protein